MKIRFMWSKGLFSNLYKIHSDGELIGNLRDKSFSQSAKGVFKGKEYIFKTNGFLKQHTIIIDCFDNKVIGRIEYNNWMSKAIISINNKTVNWKYDNIWNTKWSLFDSDGIIMTFTGSTTKGQIYSNVDDALLILSGLFVTNYYWQMTIAVLVAVFVPIWVTVIN